ncbi:36673_t:CDS:1, partial [Gigaspora margarita]
LLNLDQKLYLKPYWQSNCSNYVSIDKTEGYYNLDENTKQPTEKGELVLFKLKG